MNPSNQLVATSDPQSVTHNELVTISNSHKFILKGGVRKGHAK